ncbi:MAG: B12-binding domain-containing radical SAM protein [Phycisphaerales bacterium JB060]
MYLASESPHLTLVALSGVRVREAELAEMGMSLPGLGPRGWAIAALPPLGVLTLAGLTPDNWGVSLHEPAEVDETLVQRIVAEQPTLVGISALTASILEAYILADALRREGVCVVLGGLHVTACPTEAIQHADAVVVGDGEPVWPSVLEDARRGTLQPLYKADRPFDMRTAPLPRYDLLGNAKRQRFTMQASRGCPFSCDFCAASRLLGPFRQKPADRLRDELRAITAIDPRPSIELADDNTFALGGPHDDLLDTLGESNARWFTEADWRLGENPAVLDRLAKAGCVQVLVGLESLVHQHAGMGAKKTEMPRMLDAVRAIQAAGVAVIGCYIVGSDGENEASLDRLIEFLHHDPCADAQVTLQTPFPGTALRRRLEHEGRLLPDTDWSHCTLFDVTYQPDHMTPESLRAGYARVLASAFDESSHRRRSAIRRETWRNNPRMRA